MNKFTREEIENKLQNAGWYSLWHPDNWVPPDCKNPDWGGYPIDKAFDIIMKEEQRVASYATFDAMIETENRSKSS